MDNKERLLAPRQASLALGTGAHWEHLPREVRDHCRELVVQILMSLAPSQAAEGEDDDER